MKKSSSIFIQLFLIGCIILFSSQNNAIASDEIEQIKQAINNKGAKWTAGENWVTQLSPEQRRQLCGAILEPADLSVAELLSIPLVDSLPSQLDWRNNNGNWVTPPKNQGRQCGSCWDFSAVAQVESWWKIYNHDVDSMIDLSEQFILSCGDAGSCDGGRTELALDFVRRFGVPTESCFTYQADDEIPCSLACDYWQEEAVKIPGWGWITLDEDIIENIKNAVYRHPVSAGYTVYEDFYSYSGGVYEHVWGNAEGEHAILIVGWNDDEQSWICKNSWGPNWGDQGYFRIKWSNCGIGTNIPFIWDEMAGGSALTASPDQLDLSLIFGDSITKNITLKNFGSDLLQYSAMDYEVPVMFHPDSFMAWDDLSWWCGDPQSGGYGDHWLQYLETPVLDLSNTNSPELAWMGFWSVEDPSGTEPPWDGWDGCNVWVSIDSGNTFNVAYPISPQYNCQSLWSFGHPEQGWNLGVGVPGWGGSSGGWVPVTFDLSPYRSENVIIRFAMASDLAFSVQDDSTMYGFFVDEINVSDGSQVIFENHGDDLLSMRRIGRGFELADWLDITNGVGAIQPNDSTSLDITFNTRNLTPGQYQGLISINSNDTIVPSIEIPLSLDLRLADHDIAIEQLWLPGETIPILFPSQFGAKIHNCGLNDASNFYVACNILSGTQVIYGDTAHVPLMLSGTTQIVKFDPFLALEPGNLNFEIKLINLTDDYNAYNNINRSTSIATNLVDGFETETGFWDFKGGWGATNKLGAYNGNSVAHVNSGSAYLNNMDATMTFTPGFNLASLENATLKFWTKYVTETNRDICYLEASGDSLNWTQLDSLSGIVFSTWIQREVELTEFINAGFDKVWIRFHFISDNANTATGVLIDDVEIFSEGPTRIAQMEANKPIPTEWKLSQNYPNPFNLNTQIEYTLPEPGDVKIVIYNINGEIVRNLLNSHVNPGVHFINWDGRDNAGNIVGSGIYIYQIQIKGFFSDIKKMILLK